MAQTSLCWTFPKSQRSGLAARDNRGPDPGSYDVSGKGIVSGAQPVYSIGKAKRSGPVKGMHQVPGPGQYESQQKAFGS